jgi:uncharacterized protein DUF4145
MALESWWDLGEHVGVAGQQLHVGSIVCPHCLRRGNFRIEYTSALPNPSLHKTMNFVVLKCNDCVMSCFVMWSASRSGAGGMYDYRVYPPCLKGDPEAPEHWPKQVGSAWEQAHKAINTKSWDAAAAMAGRALQALTRGHFKAKHATLEKEIEELGGKGILPVGMVEWAHEIRLLRNIGAHPDQYETSVDATDAKDIVEFLDYFIAYALNLPKQIADYKARRAQKRV